jgi:hypothetical protein
MYEEIVETVHPYLTLVQVLVQAQTPILVDTEKPHILNWLFESIYFHYSVVATSFPLLCSVSKMKNIVKWVKQTFKLK